MTTTTDYGTWANYSGDSLTVEDTVSAYLGDFADRFLVEELVAAYREKINESLPEGVSLCGDQFYGPYPRKVDWDDLGAAVDAVDLEVLCRQYDLDYCQVATSAWDSVAGVWQIIDREDIEDLADFDDASLAAADVGGNVGEKYLLELRNVDDGVLRSREVVSQ